MKKASKTTQRSIKISGFDPLGEPEIRIKSNGLTELRFEFMPPSFVDPNDANEKLIFDTFHKRIESAVRANVEWDDREIFLIHSSADCVIDALVNYLSNYRSNKHKRYVEITAAPLSDESIPDEIKQAWIGLTLPLSELAFILPRKHKFTINANGKITEVEQLGFWVETIIAVNVLRKTNPTAAKWWEDNKPELLQPAKSFIYNCKCCKEVYDDKTSKAMQPLENSAAAR
jgi:hypothetical protein